MTWCLKKSLKRRKTTPRCPGHRWVIFCWCPVYWKFWLPVSQILGSFDSWCPGYRGVLTPGVPDTGEFWLPVSRIPGSFDSLVSWTPGESEIPGVWDTGDFRLVFWQFTDLFKLQAIATAFKAIIYQKSLWIFHLLYKYIWFMILKIS